MHLSYRMRSFHLFSSDSSTSQWGGIRERGSENDYFHQLLASLSPENSESEAADSWCERTKEDPWNTYTWNLCNTGGYCRSPEEKTSLSGTHFSVVRKTFKRQTKSLCMEKHGSDELRCVHSFTDAWRCYLTLISEALMWIQTHLSIFSCLSGCFEFNVSVFSGLGQFHQRLPAVMPHASS